MTDEQLARHTLETTGCSCVAVKNGQAVVSEMSGVRPLMLWLQDQPELLRGACVADKIVGKAAALLLLYGGVTHVYGAVMSDPAAALFRQHGMPYTCTTRVEHIRNRTNTGICPMEQRVAAQDSPAAAYADLKQFLSEKTK